MQRKRLAVVLADAGNTYQKNLLQGLLAEAFRDDLDVCVFTAFMKHGSPEKYQTGESNIYSLINLEKFDGLIIVPDTVKFTGVTDKLAEQCMTISLPVVTVDYQVEDFPCVWGGDSDDIEQLVDHLIDVHGCKVIDFLSGVKAHPHSLNREAGYIRSLEKHGIPVEPERIHYCDFGREKSAETAEDILNSGRPLPQGIASVCDSSVEALAEEFIARGYDIPGDLKLTGYDTTAPSAEAVGNVTTMYRNSAHTGVRAVQRMYQLLYGKEPEHKAERIASSVITSKSCGCGLAAHKPNYKSNNRRDQFFIGSTDFYSAYNFMLEDLIAIDTYEEFFWNLNWYTRYVYEPDGLYICTCDEWKTESDEEKNGYRTAGYPDKVTQVYILEGGEASVDPERTIDSKLMLPSLYNDSEKPSVYYFTPLHFNDRCFGYTVLRYIDKPIVFNDEYADWMRNVDNAFESMRRRLTMKFLYESRERIRAFSVTDSLTGIYNRNGFNSMAVEMFDGARSRGDGILVLVGDMNNLKPINDTYGHIEGDDSIKAAAQAMKRVCEGTEKCFRIGGDEFVIIGTGSYTEEGISAKLAAVGQHIDEYNQASGKPYRISISLGYVYGAASGFDRIENALSAADEKMFISKQAYKKQRN